LYIDSISPTKTANAWGSSSSTAMWSRRACSSTTTILIHAATLNLRATYSVTGSFFRKSDTTPTPTDPNDFHAVADREFRLAIEPGLTARRAPSFTWRRMLNYR